VASLDWSKLPNQREFDRLVEAFFVNENSDLGKEAYAVNGRGGDEGIDIHIRRRGRLNIVQLKFFSEGFSGGFKDRRKQILKSFKSALKHDPDEWTLVIPATLTSAERKYVVELPNRQRPPLTRPTITVFDQPRLDQLVAKHPDLVTYFSRDELLEAAKMYNQEKALLVDQSDLSSRLAALAKQGNTLDPDWRMDTFTQGDVTGTILVAKHPHAAARSPITLKLNASFGSADTELRERFEKVLAYGTPERVDLPASVVKDLTVEGPPAFARSTESAEISLIPAASEHVGRPFTLAFYDGDRRVASFTGETTWLGGAKVGASIHALFYKALTATLELPFDKKSPVSMSMSMSFAGREPAEVVRAVTLLEHVHSGFAMVLELDGDELTRMLPRDPAQSALGGARPEIFSHKSIAEDLVAVQEATSLYFPYPEAIPPDDRVYLRCLRLLLEGRCIVLPGYREFNQVLTGPGRRSPAAPSQQRTAADAHGHRGVRPQHLRVRHRTR
jgi:hypothetical protein